MEKNQTKLDEAITEIITDKPGKWLPENPKIIIEWINSLRQELTQEKKQELLPVMKKFKNLINNDPIVRMYFTKMIDQVPGYYKENPGAGHNLKSIDEMIELINKAIQKSPEYNDTELVGFPINAILDWAMGTSAGYAVFRLEQVNEIFREILDEYGKFLSSSKSLESIKGWMSEGARKKLKMDQFICTDEPPLYGFKSWNDFFIRQFYPDQRPVADRRNNKVIVSACESTVYSIQSKVKRSNWFWVKAQPYSLADMLAKAPDMSQKEHDELVDLFVGGDVYQAFLSATKYHRWHSPVSGTIIKAFNVPGTYYSEADSEGMDSAGPNDSQGYITQVATRAIIYIEADDPEIGLMAVMPVGMAEVSSCVISAEVGKHIDKGEELGYFQFGGSTYCLIFQPGVIKEFTVKEQQNVLLHQQIAIAK